MRAVARVDDRFGSLGRREVIADAGRRAPPCRRGWPPDSRRRPWPHVVLTPARAPLSELAGHVAALAGSDAATLRATLRADPAGFALSALESGRLHENGGGAC